MTEGPLVSVLPRATHELMLIALQAVKEYIELLRLGIARHSKATIVMESEILGDLFIKLFDLRRVQLSVPTEDSFSVAEVEDVEESVSQCAIAMIYKLNDACFRPLFLRMSEWANHVKSQSERRRTMMKQITWYTFLLKFFDSLKVGTSDKINHIY